MNKPTSGSCEMGLTKRFVKGQKILMWIDGVAKEAIIMGVRNDCLTFKLIPWWIRKLRRLWYTLSGEHRTNHLTNVAIARYEDRARMRLMYLTFTQTVHQAGKTIEDLSTAFRMLAGSGRSLSDTLKDKEIFPRIEHS